MLAHASLPKTTTPLPSPPPQGGREQTERVASVCASISSRFPRSRDLVNSAAQCGLLALGRAGAPALAGSLPPIFQDDMPDRGVRRRYGVEAIDLVHLVVER